MLKEKGATVNAALKSTAHILKWISASRLTYWKALCQVAWGSLLVKMAEQVHSARLLPLPHLHYN